MTTKADLVEQILGLSPEGDLDRLRMLTRQLVEFRDSPQLEKLRFEGTRARGITGFCGDLLPRWERVLVTGGTGCVGSVVLRNLVDDLPDAQFASVARHPPAPDRLVDQVSYLRGDVRSAKQMAGVMRDFRPDLVIHLAAQRSPALAERRVAETVSTNVIGSQVVLEAAGEAGVGTLVIASTGKAVRLFTGDTYAATKKLVEYQTGVEAGRHDMQVSCARFTHVVDNSIVGQNILKWIANDEPILLHSPLVLLPVQSALECYQLLMTAGVIAEQARPKVVALRDLGWPPITLLDLTLDYLADNPDSQSPIVFTGYPPGYEAEAYPGTYDPLSAGDVSPLMNCIEATRTKPTPVLGDFIDYFELPSARSGVTDRSLRDISDACQAKRKNDQVIRDLLRNASAALLHHSMDLTEPDRVSRIHRLGSRHDPLVDDHAFIHRQLETHVNSELSALV
jgi:hypothetical protein